MVQAWELHGLNLRPALALSVRQRTLLRNERRGIVSRPCRASPGPSQFFGFALRASGASMQAQHHQLNARNVERAFGIQCPTTKVRLSIHPIRARNIRSIRFIPMYLRNIVSGQCTLAHRTRRVKRREVSLCIRYRRKAAAGDDKPKFDGVMHET